MKTWHYDQIAPAANGCIDGTLAGWPYLAEALSAQGIRLPTNTPASALQAICRLILNERKTIETTAESDEVKELQAKLLEREVYVNCHDIAECRRGYCEAFAFIGWLSDLEEVDYIAARIGK